MPCLIMVIFCFSGLSSVLEFGLLNSLKIRALYPFRGPSSSTQPVFVNISRSPGIDSQPGAPVRQLYLSNRPARLHRLTESIPPLLTFTNTGSVGERNFVTSMKETLEWIELTRKWYFDIIYSTFTNKNSNK